MAGLKFGYCGNLLELEKYIYFDSKKYHIKP